MLLMYGPAVCPRALVAGDIRSASLAGSTPICALYMSIPDERVRTSASAFATVARAATVAYKLNTNATKISTVSEPSPHMTKTILLAVGPDDDSSVGGSASINSSSLPNAGAQRPEREQREPPDRWSALLGAFSASQYDRSAPLLAGGSSPRSQPVDSYNRTAASIRPHVSRYKSSIPWRLAASTAADSSARPIPWPRYASLT